jgi:hypothetical protein
MRTQHAHTTRIDTTHSQAKHSRAHAHTHTHTHTHTALTDLYAICIYFTHAANYTNGQKITVHASKALGLLTSPQFVRLPVIGDACYYVHFKT